MNTIPVKIKKLHPDANVPSYGRPGDAGLDLYSCEDFVLEPGVQHIFKTGICFSIPQGYVGLIWDRSGLAAKNGIKNLGGVIDHTYRGDIGVALINCSKIPYSIKKGDRIAQLLIQPVASAEVHVVEELDDTHRGEGAWGSSGR